MIIHDSKETVDLTSKDLLSEYMLQSSTGDKHSYSEQLHNDNGSGCCLGDLCNCGCNACACCEWFSMGGCW